MQSNLQQNIEQNQEINLREKQRSIAAANQNSTTARIVNISYFMFGVLELLLLLRVLLHLIGANPANGFAAIVNGLSFPFVVLFSNLVQNPALSTTATLEITTIIAMVVYAILAWLVGRMIWLMMSRPR
jgi:YggT family protein